MILLSILCVAVHLVRHRIKRNGIHIEMSVVYVDERGGGDVARCKREKIGMKELHKNWI